MIGMLRQIILCVTAASLFGSIVLSLTEQKGQREIIRVAIGMMLVLALATPLRSVRFPDFSSLLDGWSPETQSYRAENTYQAQVLEEFETEVEAYLEQCAEENGVSCSAEVIAEQDGSSVCVRSAKLSFSDDVTAAQREEIGAMAAQELGITEQEIMLAGGEPDGTEESAVDTLLE